MKKIYFKPQIIVKHYNITNVNMENTSSISVYDAGSVNDIQYTLGTLNS